MQLRRIMYGKGSVFFDKVSNFGAIKVCKSVYIYIFKIYITTVFAAIF